MIYFFFSGVYILFNSDQTKCLYIGQAEHIGNRLWRHHCGTTSFGKKFKKFYLCIRPEKFRFERFALEAKLIDRLKPEYNKIKKWKVRK